VERFLKRLDWLRFVTIALLACVIATPTTALPGDLDTTFNSTGSFGPFAITSGDSNGRAMALQPDGRIIVAGYCEKSDTNSDTDFCALRLNRDGTLDTSFTGPGGTAAGFFTVDLGYPSEKLAAVRLQSDGKIVLAGTCGSSGTSGMFCLARLNTNGSLDTTFDGPLGGGNGSFDLSFASGPNGDTLIDMAIQADDKIVVAGTCRPSIYDQFCIARLNANNGSYDASFDGPNSAGTGLGTGNGRFVRHIVSTTSYETLGALYIQSDGNIVLGGSCGDVLCMMRLLASDGSFDTSFDGPASSAGNGRWAQDITFCTFSCQVRGIAEGLLDGSTTSRALVIAVYNSESGNPAYRIAILGMSSGSHFSFITGTDGRIFLFYPFFEMTRLIERANDRLFLGTGGQAIVARATPSLGSGWGAERGINRTVPDVSRVHATLQLPDGRVVVLGTKFLSTNQVSVTRLQGGPYECAGDFDGDGRVLATVDSLISMRVALGMNTSTVIAGINFPPGATRTTWPAIRDYMIQNCGFGQLQ
jgi:uncharacterized delta-60 repeat protein